MKQRKLLKKPVMHWSH